jgi:nitrite reductase (NADH) small subunit/3-phenylpropionate/trans-cinnamate dioxygenase ferredoxin subunit
MGTLAEESGINVRKGVKMGQFITVVNATEIDQNELFSVGVGEERIAIANVGGAFHAFDSTCTHRRCSLAEGELEGTVVTCPCHGCQFDVTTGKVLRGPAQQPVHVYAARVMNWGVQVEI